MTAPAKLPGLGPDELAAIEAAVTRAERLTGGEIVTYLVGECDSYPEARWCGVVLGGLGGIGVALLVHALGAFWGGPLWLWSLLPALVGSALGATLASVPTLRRRLIAARTMEAHVALRAESAFLEEEVFATADRTGVLLFLALFEHRAVVLADRGINDKVESGTWEGIVERLAAGARAGHLGDALVSAIEECGRLLQLHGVARRGDDVDELSDAARLRDR